MDNKSIRKRRLVLQQIAARVHKIKEAVEPGPPVKGWIRAIREALGMTGSQLADRLQVAQSRISRLEQDELVGSVTLRTMRQAAEAMDCAFVYAIVPRTSLDDVIQKQAKIVIQSTLKRTSHTMMLEDQKLSKDEQKKMLETMAEDLIRENPRRLWSTRVIKE